MMPKSHFLLGLVVSVILYFGFNVGILGCFIFLVATVGIDIDHYLYYVYRKKDWNLGKAARWWTRNNDDHNRMDRKFRRDFYTGFCFLHGIEVLGLMVLFGYFIWDLFYFVALGILLHLILDHINQAIVHGRLDKFSIIYDYFKYDKLKFVEEIEELGEMAIGLKK